MRSPSGVAALVADLAVALEGVPWCLIGGQAAILFGSMRATLDVDVSAAVPDDERERTLRRLELGSFAPRIGAPLEFARRTRVLLLIHTPTGIALDLVFAGDGLERDFLARARSVDIDGARVRVIAPEDLVASKLLAGRPRDLEDVEAVVRRNPGLDRSKVRGLLALFEQALDRSDLRSEFERIVGCIETRQA